MIGRAASRVAAPATSLATWLAVAALTAGTACAAGSAPTSRATNEGAPEASDAFAAARARMVDQQLVPRGIDAPGVLEAMRAVPRHEFVPEPLREVAHADRPLPIGESQTISQPYIVALMTQLSGASPGRRVLEIGTGSGYQAAVLAQVGAEVWTIEIVPNLAERARRTLERLGYGSIRFRVGDGYAGWPEAAPFDAIVVTAAPDHVPQPLVDQLAEGGRLVIPVGDAFQTLDVLTRTADGVRRETVLPVRFVPMTGEAQRKDP